MLFEQQPFLNGEIEEISNRIWWESGRKQLAVISDEGKATNDRICALANNIVRQAVAMVLESKKAEHPNLSIEEYVNSAGCLRDQLEALLIDVYKSC
jgi:hypothetical protein